MTDTSSLCSYAFFMHLLQEEIEYYCNLQTIRLVIVLSMIVIARSNATRQSSSKVSTIKFLMTNIMLHVFVVSRKQSYASITGLPRRDAPRNDEQRDYLIVPSLTVYVS